MIVTTPAHTSLLRRLRERRVRASAQDGSPMIIGIALILFMCLPCMWVLYNISITADASTQAQAIAYNLAYSSLSRGVDQNASASSEQLQLDQNDPNVNQDANTLAQSEFYVAGLSSSDIHMSVAPASCDGVNAGSCPVTMINADRGSTPEQLNAADYSRDCNGTAPTASSSTGVVGYVDHLANGNHVDCWIDDRSIEDPSDTSAFVQYASGDEATIDFSIPLFFMNAQLPGGGSSLDISGERIGVASFTRNCENGAPSCPQ
jgi:hypothetical protein